MPPKKRTDGKTIYPTGFCLDGNHEATRKVSPSGKPMRTCDFWETCPCKCHEEITEMCRIAGIDRLEPEQSPEYLAAVRKESHEFWHPSDEDYAPHDGLSIPDGVGTHPDTSDPVATPRDTPADVLSTGPHGTVTPTWTPTPTGRRARGQLEEDVREICDEYTHDVYDWDFCTPKNVAERIAVKYAIEPPSTGAINAVWDRWEKLGFAKQDKKPSRFVCFEMDGSAATLVMLKERTKRDKKRFRAEQRRGTLRPTGR